MFVTFGADVLLLKDEPDPKCFTRTEEDFTCFFETADNRTYDLLYNVNGYVSNHLNSTLPQNYQNYIYIFFIHTFNMLLFIFYMLFISRLLV